MRRDVVGIILAVWVSATLSAAGLMLFSEERYVYVSASGLARTIGTDAFTTGTTCEPIIGTETPSGFAALAGCPGDSS
jgi:uncharacterized membrane protein (DUF441 family)